MVAPGSGLGWTDHALPFQYSIKDSLLRPLTSLPTAQAVQPAASVTPLRKLAPGPTAGGVFHAWHVVAEAAAGAALISVPARADAASIRNVNRVHPRAPTAVPFARALPKCQSVAQNSQQD